MFITRVTLDNIKSYRHADIALAPGAIAIRGHNGAGKSTLIEAIGFALFDFLPYANRGQFVREGEKSGKVAVRLVSASDGREYEVERRCHASGTGAWFVHDPQLHSKPAEGKDDVLAFLRQHLGLATTLPLPDLFDNAIAVQQGTFTADFLLTPALRKKKFDGLLQVEDYSKAAAELLKTDRFLRDQIAELEKHCERLTAQTADLPLWRQERETARQQRADWGERAATLSAERLTVEQRQTELQAAKDALAELDQERERRFGAWQTAQAAAHAATQDHERAAAAQRIRAGTAPDAQRHGAARDEHARLLEAERQAAAIRLRLARAEQALTAANHAAAAARDRLDRAAAAAQERDRLTPLVARQDDLEARLRAAQEADKLLALRRVDAQRAAHDLDAARAEHAQATAEIARLRDLAPLVAELETARAQVADLRQAAATLRERETRRHALTTQITRLEQQAAEASRAAAEAETRAAEARAAQDRAADLPARVQALTALETSIADLRAQRRHAEHSLHASQGGQCPFLKEPCQNLARRGLGSLEEFFGDEVARLTVALSPQERELATVRADVDALRAAGIQAGRLAEYEQQATSARSLAAAQAGELTLARDEAALVQTALDEARDLPARLHAAERLVSERAAVERQFAGLPAQQDRLRRADDAIQQHTQRVAALHAETADLATRAAAIPALRQDLAALGNPREQAAQAGALAAQTGSIQDEWARYAEAAASAARQIADLQTALAPFADLPAQLAAAQATIAATQAAHDAYLRAEAEAARLPETTRRAAETAASAAAAEAAHQHAHAAHQHAAAAFDPADLIHAQEHLRAISTEITQIAERLDQARQRSAQLDAQIAEGDERAALLARLTGERDAALGTQSLLNYGRDTIREAGPTMMRALLRQISGEANRIFGEVMGDRAATLEWDDDYTILLRAGGYQRTFAQLSGGEQMSAALAVRLALLRTLTSATIAIFDEPTQNMDGERRTNLAEQIRRVRGFDQLLVISHDDTFEDGLDAVVTVSKEGGESSVQSDARLLAAPPSFAQAAFGA